MIWITLCVLSFILAALWQKQVGHPLLNPTLWSTIVCIVAILVTKTPYQTFVLEVEPIVKLLAPAVVALAVPLYRLRKLLAQQWKALFIGGLVGTLSSMCVNISLSQFLGLEPAMQKILMISPVTSPVALQLAEVLGAPGTLAATMAVITGLSGALFAPMVLSKFKVTHPLCRGIAVGSISHGIGTARAREESDLAGTASSLGMGLAVVIVTGVVTLIGLF